MNRILFQLAWLLWQGRIEVVHSFILFHHLHIFCVVLGVSEVVLVLGSLEVVGDDVAVQQEELATHAALVQNLLILVKEMLVVVCLVLRDQHSMCLLSMFSHICNLYNTAANLTDCVHIVGCGVAELDRLDQLSMAGLVFPVIILGNFLIADITMFLTRLAGSHGDCMTVTEA